MGLFRYLYRKTENTEQINKVSRRINLAIDALDYGFYALTAGSALALAASGVIDYNSALHIIKGNVSGGLGRKIFEVATRKRLGKYKEDEKFIYPVVSMGSAAAEGLVWEYAQDSNIINGTFSSYDLVWGDLFGGLIDAEKKLLTNALRDLGIDAAISQFKEVRSKRRIQPALP